MGLIGYIASDAEGHTAVFTIWLGLLTAKARKVEAECRGTNPGVQNTNDNTSNGRNDAYTSEDNASGVS